MIQLGGLLKKTCGILWSFNPWPGPAVVLHDCNHWWFWHVAMNPGSYPDRFGKVARMILYTRKEFRAASKCLPLQGNIQVYTLLLARITSWRLQQNWSTWIIFSRVFTKVSKTQLFVPSSECLTMQGKKRHVLLQLKTKHPSPTPTTPNSPSVRVEGNP